MSMPALGRRALGLLAVALIAGAAGLAARSSGILGWLERNTVDARFSLRGAEHAPADVVVVGIDNDSLGQLPRYPFSRRRHARVIENLHRAGARLIVYDITFDRPSTPEADNALYEAARRAAPVVFATTLIGPQGQTEVLGGNANLAAIRDRAAAAYLLPDGDGTLRHLLDQVRGLPTLAAAAGAELGKPASAMHLLRGGWIDFAGPPKTARYLSFVRVLRGHFDPALVRGKVVIVGATAPVLQDLHDTAVGSPMSGPEVQANAIATTLAGFPLRSPSDTVSVLLVVLLALAVPVCALRLGTLGLAAVAVGAAALWSLAAQLTFDSGTVLDYSDPMIALLLATAGALALGLWRDSRERRRLRELFAADAGGVVEQILHPAGSPPLPPTAIIAGYRIEEVVGRGGMGVVYRARQLALDRAVAIKLIAPERLREATFRERFQSESRIAASIEHANVIPVYEAGEDDGLLFIAMRLVDGLDLEQLLQRSGTLDHAMTISLLGQLAGALDAAHACGLVHRDVKPANALVTFDEPEHVYLTDFGLAKHVGVDAGLTQVDRWVGTLDYLSPEQIRGEAVDGRADVYALAGVLYRCLTGEVPFVRDSEPAKLWAHVNASPPSPRLIDPQLPAALDAVIARGMAKDREQRYQTAGELARACLLAFGIARPEAPARAAVPGGARGDPARAVSETKVSDAADSRTVLSD